MGVRFDPEFQTATAPLSGTQRGTGVGARLDSPAAVCGATLVLPAAGGRSGVELSLWGQAPDREERPEAGPVPGALADVFFFDLAQAGRQHFGPAQVALNGRRGRFVR